MTSEIKQILTNSCKSEGISVEHYSRLTLYMTAVRNVRVVIGRLKWSDRDKLNFGLVQCTLACTCTRMARATGELDDIKVFYDPRRVSYERS